MEAGIKIEPGKLDPRLWSEWEYSDRYFINVEQGVELISSISAYISGEKDKWRSRKYIPRDMYVVELVKYFFGADKKPIFKVKQYVGSPTPVFELMCHHPPVFIDGSIHLTETTDIKTILLNFFSKLDMNNIFNIKERHRIFSIFSKDLNQDITTCHVSEIVYNIGYKDVYKPSKSPIILQDLEFGMEKNEKITSAEINAFRTFFRRFVDFNQKVPYTRYLHAVEEFSKWYKSGEKTDG